MLYHDETRRWSLPTLDTQCGGDAGSVGGGRATVCIASQKVHWCILASPELRKWDASCIMGKSPSFTDYVIGFCISPMMGTKHVMLWILKGGLYHKQQVEATGHKAFASIGKYSSDLDDNTWYRMG